MHYRVKGILYYTNYKAILWALQDVFVGISVKPRIFGYDITYLEEFAEVYITTTDNDEKEYYVDILFRDRHKFWEAKENLKQNLLKEDILFDLSFIIDDGNEIEEEPFIHPDFLKRFTPPSDLA